MTSSAYAKLALCGTLSSFLALACTFTSGDGDGDFGTGGAGGGNSGGATGGSKAGGTGGKSTGGATAGATGGAAAGGTAAGGATASGGAGTGGGEAVMCNDTGTLMPTTTIEMCDVNSLNPCKKCISMKCCAQFEACNGGAPKTPCGYGAKDGQGEVLCIQACVLDAGLSDEVSFTECRTKCKTTAPACASVDPATDALIGCLNPGTTQAQLEAGCLAECFQQ